jgi:arylsulfatase A-like enzyme
MRQTLPLFFVAAFALAGLPTFGQSAEPIRPNFVVVVSDDHTFRAIGYRNPQVSTPHLNELAASGFRFDRFFVASPICVASRACLYSGVYPQQHQSVGLEARGFARTVISEHRYMPLAEALGRGGYHTALYGKSHLGDPKKFGFAEGREINDRDDFETFAEAEKFVRRSENHSRPFLLWVTPHNPHLPLTPPAEFLQPYQNVDIQLDPNFREQPQASSLLNQGLPGEMYFRDGNKTALSGGPPRSSEQIKSFIRAYYAEISLLDDQIGKLMDTFGSTGLDERTIFIYLADNGYHLGNHGLGNKITMHEESVRVPCFFHSPLLPRKGARSDALASSLDIYPTLLDFAGIEPPPHLMGQSLRKVLTDPAAVLRDAVVSECVGVGGKLGQGHRMVRTDRFKYMLSGDNDEGFFDLQADPYELHNLASDTHYAKELQDHRNRLSAWMDQVGDTHERPKR